MKEWREKYGTCNECWKKVMEQWLNKPDATWDSLYVILNDLRFVEVARELEEAVKSCSAQ